MILHSGGEAHLYLNKLSNNWFAPIDSIFVRLIFGTFYVASLGPPWEDQLTRQPAPALTQPNQVL